MLPGVHKVRRPLANGQTVEHWYAWRGGPSILRVTAHPTALGRAVALAQAEAARKYHALMKGPETAALGFLAGLINGYLASPQFAQLGDRTRADRRKHLLVVRDELGDMPMNMLEVARSDIIEWRDQYAATPRTADHYVDALACAIAWGRDRGLTHANPLDRWPRLYRVDRSEIIWEPDEIEAICAKADEDLKRAILLAVNTGLRQADLLSLTWSSVGPDDIVRETRKRKRIVRIPITDDARLVLASCPRVSTHVLTRAGRPWKVSTLEKYFSLARTAAEVKGKRWHDFRGTFATLLIAAGAEVSSVDQIMGWAPGSAEQMRARYVGSKAVSMAVIERLRRLHRAASN